MPVHDVLHFSPTRATAPSGSRRCVRVEPIDEGAPRIGFRWRDHTAARVVPEMEITEYETDVLWDFLVKARHSAFYATLLEYVLESEGVGRVVLTGQATEQCILYTALDAYVRHFQVTVPRDAVAHIHEHLAGSALEMMERNMHAEITNADETPLHAENGGGRRPTH